MLVLHVGEPSGPSRSFEPSARWLAEGGELNVVVPNEGAVADLYREFASVEVMELEALTIQGGPLALLRRLAGLVPAVRELRRRIRERRPELIVQATVVLPAVGLAARLERVPLIVYTGELFPSSGIRSVAGRLSAWVAGRTAAGIAVCSAPVAGRFRAARVPIEMILPPMDEQDYASGDRMEVRSKLGVGADADCVVAVGSLSEGRGQDVLLKAMAAVRRERPGARCLIFGAPHPRPQDFRFTRRLEAMAGELGLQDAVALPGQVDDLAGVYAAADVVVNPARIPEAFGRVAFEAALAGRPTVSTDVGAVPEYLSDGESALLVPRGDSQALASAIVKLLGDPELGQRLAANAAAFARRSMTSREAVDRFAKLTSRALSGRALG